jgi:hypothetical protein
LVGNRWLMFGLQRFADSSRNQVESEMSHKPILARLFNHLVGEREQDCWQIEAEYFRSVQVDQQFEQPMSHMGHSRRFERRRSMTASLQ